METQENLPVQGFLPFQLHTGKSGNTFFFLSWEMIEIIGEGVIKRRINVVYRILPLCIILHTKTIAFMHVASTAQLVIVTTLTCQFTISRR